MNPAPKAIFFDLDGTILDWQTGMEESWLASCEKHCDGSYAPAQLHEAIRVRRTWFWDDRDRAYRGRMDLDGASREIVRHAFADLGLRDNDVAHSLADYYRSLRTAAIAPYPGAIETLHAFRERGIAMALITNGEARNQRRSVETHALEQYFDCIVIEGEFGAGKPDERVFRHALAATGLRSRAGMDGRRQPRSRHRDAAPPRHAHRLGGRGVARTAGVSAGAAAPHRAGDRGVGGVKLRAGASPMVVQSWL